MIEKQLESPGYLKSLEIKHGQHDQSTHGRRGGGGGSKPGTGGVGSKSKFGNVDSTKTTPDQRDAIANKMSSAIAGKIVRVEGDELNGKSRKNTAFSIVSNHSGDYIAKQFKDQGFKKSTMDFLSRGSWSVKVYEGSKLASNYDKRSELRVLYTGN